MRSNTVIVGVDRSPAAATAARLGWQLALAANAPCRLVHVTRDLAPAIGKPRPAYRAAGRRAFLLGALRTRLERALTGAVPPDVLHGLVVREGDVPTILEEEAQAAGAEFLVLGAKRHSAVGRWLIGSTVHSLVRTSRVPVLVAVEPVTRIRRVLAAVDTSGAARATIAAARRLVDLHGAELRILSVDGFNGEANDWPADLVVMASHEKQWIERSLQHPTRSLLIVPAHAEAAFEEESESEPAVCAVGPEPT